MDKKIRRYLSSKAVNIKSTIAIGKEGITDNVIETIKNELFSHELIKINLLPSIEISFEELEKISKLTESEIVHKIGRKLVLYKKTNKKNAYHYLDEKNEPNI